MIDCSIPGVPSRSPKLCTDPFIKYAAGFYVMRLEHKMTSSPSRQERSVNEFAYSYGRGFEACEIGCEEKYAIGEGCLSVVFLGKLKTV